MASILQALLASFLVLVLLLPQPGAYGAKGRRHDSPVTLNSNDRRPNSVTLHSKNRRPNFVSSPWKNAKATFYDAGDGTGKAGKVPCRRQGGIRFTIEGSLYFNLVTVWNVGGAGDVTGVKVKGDDEVNWSTLWRNWGQKWETNAQLVGKALSIRVTTSDRRTSTSWFAAPKNWQFGRTFEGKNFI
ncbi:hypothetical protein U1Q18_013064 [Sarracenia purpurea var. burkii]